MSLSYFGGYLLQHVPTADLIDFVQPAWFSKQEPPKGFVIFRHAIPCMTIFYPEVKSEQNEMTGVHPHK